MPHVANQTSFKKGHAFLPSSGTEQGFKKGHKTWNKGTRGLTSANRTSFKKGQEAWNRGTKGIMKPNSTTFKKGEFTMDKHPQWKGGISFVKGEALKRDDWTCRCVEECGWHVGDICEFSSKEIMEVDHIKSRVEAPELKHSLGNLITLCPNCHRKKTNLFLSERLTGKKYKTKK